MNKQRITTVQLEQFPLFAVYSLMDHPAVGVVPQNPRRGPHSIIIKSKEMIFFVEGTLEYLRDMEDWAVYGGCTGNLETATNGEGTN